ncbi:hypothetical protein R55210_AODCCCNP_00563 [Fructobacillus fructosus]|uniref:KxYKxGKxW signal peptide domain-containing protein n=1 Tax=Fructobacillus fructosus TaxID=1631 RepID=UPI002D9BE5CC|nr:hypothetical protein R55210_AODCCCNP_00563 [Fructobacillus fructosus]
MNYNKLNVEKNNTKKVLHKVKKNWVIISLASFTVLGAGSFASDATISASSETTKTQAVRKELPAKQYHGNRLDKYNTLPDTAKKGQRISIAGLLGITAALGFFGLSGRRNKKD